MTPWPCFEVLSPYSLRRDMVRKRRFYERIASLTKYVVLRQDRVEATIFMRSDGFSGRTLNEPDDFIEMAELGIRIRLVDLYRDVPVG